MELTPSGVMAADLEVQRAVILAILSALRAGEDGDPLLMAIHQTAHDRLSGIQHREMTDAEMAAYRVHLVERCERLMSEVPPLQLPPDDSDPD